MKHTILMAITGLALLAGCQSGQPKMNCNLAHGSYAVTYTTVTAAAEGTRCARTNDVVGLQKYTDADGHGRVYLIPLEVGLNNFYGYSWPPPIGGEDMAIGLMEDVKPDDNDVCRISSFEAASSQENAAEGGTLKYTFSNMEFTVRPDVPGTIMKYRVTITDADEGCTGTYDAVGMFPVVTCGSAADGTPNQAACAEADHVYTGLALNPSFDVKCEANELMQFIGENVYYGPGANANMMASICVPRDPNNLFCPEAGCDWQQTE